MSHGSRVVSLETRVPVAILGATGTVGQVLVARLASHPWFRPVALVASRSSTGRPYADAVRWRLPGPIPHEVAGLVTRAVLPIEVPLVFSALSSQLAADLEPQLAAAGVTVVSNASAHRMLADVPLVIPEVNADHLALLDRQRDCWPGGIVTNPNCVTAALALALAPLHRAFGLERLILTTMQAASGAGFPGVSSLDLLRNVIPCIDGEEEKIPQELNKLLGTLGTRGITPACIGVSVHANRVPTVDGHLMTISAGFRQPVTPADVVAVLREWRAPVIARRLPTTPAVPLVLHERPDRPQPRLDIALGDGMTVSVGRVRTCPVLGVRFVVLGHNLVRGAAGAAVQLGELVKESRWSSGREGCS
ncbi:MAG TPA: aspartate-semialdehyde dehydrogenase [Gemmatimonadales bacterium]